MAEEIKAYRQYIYKNGQFRKTSGGGGAEIRVVDTLPELGEPNVLYVLDDGTQQPSSKGAVVEDTITIKEMKLVPSVAASKQIYLSVYTTALEVCFCRVHLFNFDLTDVGSKVFLYRKRNNKRRGHKAIWNHPLDYTVATQTGKNIMGCGYGILAGTTDSHGHTWLELNTYQVANGHNGFIQTEWELTETDINNGYIDINLSEMAIDLLMPEYSTDASWEEAAANTHLKFMGRAHLSLI